TVEAFFRRLCWLTSPPEQLHNNPRFDQLLGEDTGRGVKTGDNGNRDGPTDRERQPPRASHACHLSSQTTRITEAVP
ncbi:hypothetical protein KUCAC02_019883, partial [Chaenocephalus aceratus]